MSGNFEIVVEEHGTIAKVKGTTDRLVEQSKRIVEDAAEASSRTMFYFAPSSGRGANPNQGTETLKSRISWSRARWHPGGLGGGGTWEAVAGVKRSPLHPDPMQDPATFVYEGTGLFGPLHRLIVPRSGNFLVFMDGARKVFTKHVKGQPPKRLWVTAAQDRANAVVAARIALIDSRNAAMNLGG